MKSCCKCSDNCNKNKKESISDVLKTVYSNLKELRLLEDLCGIFLGIIFLCIYYLNNRNEAYFYVSFLVTLICYANTTYKLLFNAKEKFNRDTICVWIMHFFLILMVLYEKKNYEANPKQLKSYIFVLPIFVFIFALYFWLVYLACCLKVIKKIRKDKYIFLAKSAESMLKAVLVCFSSSIVVWLLPEKESIIKLYYHFINIFINITYPLLNMYIGTRLELDDYIGKIDKKD